MYWQGLIEEEKLDSFNIPYYGPSVEELRSIVEVENSFEIKSVRVLSGFPLHPLLEVREGEEQMFGRIVGKHYRALFENIVGAHLRWDEYLIDEFFARISNRAAAKYGEYLPNTLDLAIAFLLRK
jgi:jasmonate O-methyltransferase